MLPIKVCCIQSIKEARLALRVGASALGLVSEMPSGPGTLSDDEIAAIIAALPIFATSVLLTCKTDPADVILQQRHCRARVIQLVAAMPEGAHGILRAALPGVGILQVVHVTGPESIDEARSLDGRVDGILLDSGEPSAGDLGGTGRVHDWSLSRQIVEAVACPVILAGGLHACNVVAAIQQVRPAGLDLCSGVRVQDRLDSGRLRGFFSTAARADE